MRTNLLAQPRVNSRNWESRYSSNLRSWMRVRGFGVDIGADVDEAGAGEAGGEEVVECISTSSPFIFCTDSLETSGGYT